MDIEEKHEFKRLTNSFPLDFIHTPKAENIINSLSIPLNKWVIIDKSKHGINYAFKSIHSIYVYTARLFSSSFMEFDFKAFDNWRSDILKLNGE